jgi:putative Holliday junction resolvase
MVSASRDSIEAPSSRSRQTILAIDYGRKRFGLALSDPLGMTARPLAVWLRTNRRRDLARLRQLCRLHGATRIVIGRPLHLNGTEGEMAAEATKFADAVHKHLGLPVELSDERLSSWEAAEIVKMQTCSRRKTPRRRSHADDVAAAVILREYLVRRRGAA